MKDTFDALLGRYAELIVCHGLNIQPGQILNISCELVHRRLATEVARAAYRRGAKYVAVDFYDPQVARLRVEHSSLEQMGFAPRFLTDKYQELVDERGANLKIVGPEDPDVMQGLDPLKINAGRIAQYKRIKSFYEQGIDKSLVHWTVVAGATPAWGARIFKGLSSEEARARLWDQIFSLCRVNREDCLEAWAAHNQVLQRRARVLSSMGIDSLRFVGPGTDLVVGLSDRAVFKGGADKGPYGAEFEPNLPTEECFTTPDWQRTQGIVRTTRPFFINGTLVKDLVLRFERGEIAEFSASEGEAAFRAYSESDAGGRRLGEVALVGIDSPVYQSGLVFEEILFDENAACHIAIGSAYKFCLRGAESMTAADLAAIGCNESSVHTDMMISSEQVDVIATLRDGSERTLIAQGRWCELPSAVD
jgi:aminopeptidase